MKKDELKNQLLAKAKRVGRPTGTQVNVITLDVKDDSGVLIGLGDIHYGSPTCNYRKLRETIEYILDNKIKVIGMGDWFEASTRYSIGSGVYEQTMNIQKQFDALVKLGESLAKAGLLTGIHKGNHEERVGVAVGLDLTKVFARTIGVRYFGWGQNHLIRCGKESYTAYTHHGASGARLQYTKIKAVLDVARWDTSELVMLGHVHSLDTITQTFFGVDKRNKQLVKLRRIFVITGHFLEWKGSYAEQKLLVPSKTGVARINFGATNHDIHVSI